MGETMKLLSALFAALALLLLSGCGLYSTERFYHEDGRITHCRTIDGYVVPDRCTTIPIED
jgi:hypothetical protein